MRFILLSALLLTNLVAQNVTIYQGPQGTPSQTPATPPPGNPAEAAPNAATAPTAAPAVPATDPADPSAPIPGETEYTVVQGDSLWRISRKFKVSIDSIKTLNQLPNDKLKLGLVLRIPPKPEPKVKPSLKDKKTAVDAHKNPLANGMQTVSVTPPPPPPPTLQERFTSEIQQIASNKIPYNHGWIPPGEQESWIMDCSNTTRWLYKKVEGIKIERTASDQYDQLYKAGRAWKAPLIDDKPDLDFLDKHLQTGDLLFWQNTYKPDREPPITHVMLYLGKDDQGRMLMAGSQTSRGGLYNASGSGPDVYVFDPLAPSGGYNTGFFGWTHVKGTFFGYGRPIEHPEPSKPAIATVAPSPTTPPAAVDTTAKPSATVKAPN